MNQNNLSNSSQTSNPGRIPYIDQGKGLAIISVVMGHVICYDLYGFDDASSHSSLFKFIYSFHMPLFVFLSGLVSKTNIEWSDIPFDILKRFRTLMIPFLLVSIIFSLLYTGSLSLLLSNSKGGFWFLWVLFVFHMLNYPLIRIGRYKWGGFFQILSSVMVWSGLNHFIIMMPSYISEFFSLYYIGWLFPYYVIGNIIKRYNLQDFLFCNSAIFFLALCIWIGGSKINLKYTDYIITTFAIIVIMNLIRKLNYVIPNSMIMQYIKHSMEYIGRASIFIYIFHYIPILFLKNAYFLDILPKYSNFGWDLIISVPIVGISIIFSLLIKLLIEKEPNIMKYVFNRKP